MAHKELREYINALDAEGELLRIKEEVDWNEEIGHEPTLPIFSASGFL